MQTVCDYSCADCTNAETWYHADCVWLQVFRLYKCRNIICRLCVITGVPAVQIQKHGIMQTVCDYSCADCTNAETWFHADCVWLQVCRLYKCRNMISCRLYVITGVLTVQMQKHDMQTVCDYRCADCTNAETWYADCVWLQVCRLYKCINMICRLCVITGVLTVQMQKHDTMQTVCDYRCAYCTNAETWYADCVWLQEYRLYKCRNMICRLCVITGVPTVQMQKHDNMQTVCDYRCADCTNAETWYADCVWLQVCWLYKRRNMICRLCVITGVPTVQMQKHDIMQTVFDYRCADCTNAETWYHADCVWLQVCRLYQLSETLAETWRNVDPVWLQLYQKLELAETYKYARMTQI